MSDKHTKTKTTGKPKQGADSDFIGEATSWCAEHNVPTCMRPEHAVRLLETASLIDAAVTRAGGNEKVPEAVLLYRQLLYEASVATTAHAIKLSVIALFSGVGR